MVRRRRDNFFSLFGFLSICYKFDINGIPLGSFKLMDYPAQNQETLITPHVDRGLVSLFLKMSPEERLQSNDHAVRTILELRDAFKQSSVDRR